MNKYIISSLAAGCMFGLTACTSDQGMEQRYNDNTEPVGYYTSENENEHRLDQGKGPVTDMLDGDDENNNNRRTAPLNVTDGRYDSPTNSYQNPSTNKNGFYSNANIGGSDMNYHGHLNGRNNLTQTNTNAYPADLTEKVADKAAGVNGVKDCRVVVDDNRMLVAVDPANSNVNEEELKKAVQKEVKPLAKKYNLQVEVDKGMFNSVRNVDNDIRNGVDNGIIRTNINSLYESIDENVNRKDR
ncbi:YhcN/YlaJ family sporulation lipoprotein [Priestia flexa]|nr:YhcN/YlaJ family sporulation lipoprotein [Priestia flexa]